MKRISAPTRALLGLALASLALALGLAQTVGPSVVDEWQRLASGTQGVDSWRPMNQASLYLKQEHEQPLYAWLFFERKVKFIYPPTSLLYVDALRALAPSARLQGALNFASWLLVLLTAGLTAWLADRVLARAGLPATDALDRGLRLALVFGLTLGFYPVAKAYTLGQMQVVVNAAFAGLLLCWVTERRASAGALAVVMAAVKPQYGALLLWGVVRREWGFVRGAAITGVVLLLLSLGLYGLETHLDYLSVVAHVGRLGEAYWPNQTINGLLQRALGNGNSAVWDPHVYPPYHVGIHAATWLSTLLVVGLACFGRARPSGSALDIATVVLAATFASPIAWEHHYGVLPPLFVVLALPCARRFGRRGALLLAGGFLVASQYWHPLDALTNTSLNGLQSLLLYVGLGLFAALLWLRTAEQDPHRATS